MKKIVLGILIGLFMVGQCFGAIYLEGPIDNGMLNQVNREMKYAGQGMTVNIYISSPGGGVDYSIAIHDTIRHYAHKNKLKIVITAVGYCYSGGAVILQAGDVRQATPNTLMLIHAISWYDMGRATAQEQEEHIKSVRKYDKSRLASIFKKRTGIIGYNMVMDEGDHYLTVKDAIKYNIIDRVIQ